MFGYSAIPVINQKNAPAIWESDAGDLPQNHIKGRLLVELDNGRVLYDVADSDIYDPSLRILLASGGFTNGDAITVLSVGGGVFSINLGGTMTTNSSIDTSLGSLAFIGGLLMENKFDQFGVFTNTNTGKDYMPLSEIPLSVIIADCLLEIQDTRTNQIYKVAAKKV